VILGLTGEGAERALPAKHSSADHLLSARRFIACVDAL